RLDQLTASLQGLSNHLLSSVHPPPTDGATAGPSESPPQVSRLREVPSPTPEHYS
ncbi:hypothetical protein CRENBAI_009587, partial [Crenichthys baileyi]